jgi:RNA polymerase subunit RPABC4/transcription elongation factor Spt4
MSGWVILRECGACRQSESRVFTDNWTGLSLCLTCLSEVAAHITMSPEEGDNLEKVLVDAGRMYEEED